MNIVEAIEQLQAAMAVRFGGDCDTESGAATLYLAHDRVSLTDGENQVVAKSANSIVKNLEPLKKETNQ